MPNPRKGLRAHILNRLRRVKAGVQLELKQGRKIADEMLLRSGVSCAKTGDLSCIE